MKWQLILYKKLQVSPTQTHTHKHIGIHTHMCGINCCDAFAMFLAVKQQLQQWVSWVGEHIVRFGWMNQNEEGEMMMKVDLVFDEN